MTSLRMTMPRRGIGESRGTEKPSNQSESTLDLLCSRVFLSLWTYPRPFFLSYRPDGSHYTKELTDLLVIFKDDILLFSDKRSELNLTIEPALAWKRWLKKTVESGGDQLKGAEKQLRAEPTNLFMDRHGTRPIDIDLPNFDSAQIHKILIANGASLAITGMAPTSLPLATNPEVDNYINSSSPIVPHPSIDKNFFHVFDEEGFKLVVNEISTASDFIQYLTERKRFFQNPRGVFTPGEEELLAIFLSKIDSNGSHTLSTIPNDVAVTLSDGFWSEFEKSSERKSRINADRISYYWDEIIERTASYLINNELHYPKDAAVLENHEGLAEIACLNRTERRALAQALFDLLDSAHPNKRATRFVMGSGNEGTEFLLLLLPIPSKMNLESYRELRRNMLGALCLTARVKFSQCRRIVGFATEHNFHNEGRSEDFCLLDLPELSADTVEQANLFTREFGFFADVKQRIYNFSEYPPPGRKNEPNKDRCSGRNRHRARKRKRVEQEKQRRRQRKH